MSDDRLVPAVRTCAVCSAASFSQLPTVAVIVPVRNEARYIERCLASIIGQAYPAEKLEILVVDGLSDDGTREIVSQSISRDGRIRMRDNPQRIVPTALNLGIRDTSAEIVIRVDGHAMIAHDYVQRCVEVLSEVDADCVGGPIRTVGETTTAQAIAIAQSSPFGVGNAEFRYADSPRFVDTLAFGAYRRSLFDRIGFFDEELVRNQDDEFNFRLIESGGNIWLDPSIRSDYYSRASLWGLWKQYFEYGFWKVRVIQKHRRPAAWRHLVPITFVTALILSSVLALLTHSPMWLLAVSLPYLMAVTAVTVWIAARKGWRYGPSLPIAFATMHFAYGIGFGIGCAHFWLL